MSFWPIAKESQGSTTTLYTRIHIYWIPPKGNHDRKKGIIMGIQRQIHSLSISKEQKTYSATDESSHNFLRFLLPRLLSHDRYAAARRARWRLISPFSCSSSSWTLIVAPQPDCRTLGQVIWWPDQGTIHGTILSTPDNSQSAVPSPVRRPNANSNIFHEDVL